MTSALLAPAWLPQTLVSLTAVGIALSFWLADRQSATSRALAAAMACMGIGVILNVSLILLEPIAVARTGWLALPEGIAMGCFLEWLLRVRKTVPPGPYDVRGGDAALRLGQVAAATYVGLSVAYPAERLQEFIFWASVRQWGPPRAGFWIFAVPVIVVLATGLFSTILLLRRKPERAEMLRVGALVMAAPFFIGGYLLPLSWAALCILVGLMIVLAGGIQYHVQQGRRAVFLSQFLSPQVAQVVGSKGIEGAMRQATLDISVVACDLRGFTRYAQTHPSSRVIEVLSDYYRVVGDIVAAHGGTIKDYAGDGILILIGAPLPVPDHARVALAMAHEIRSVGQGLAERWSSKKGRLGIGVGVASGPVTVGVIGSSLRLEYTAVGSAVNLACRLCEEADDKEILIAPATVVQCPNPPSLEPRKPPRMKGFSQLEQIYALPAPTA